MISLPLLLLFVVVGFVDMVRYVLTGPQLVDRLSGSFQSLLHPLPCTIYFMHVFFCLLAFCDD